MFNTIEDNILKIYKHIRKQGWIAFLGAFLGGYFAHIFILTNELFNHDDILFLYEKQGDSIFSTRWLQSITTYLVSPIGSGVVAGGFTILILSISALLLVDTLKIDSEALSLMIGILMSVSPIVASFMSYVNGSYLFVVGIPFAVLTVRWFDKGIKGYVASAFALMLAIAGYQSNMAVTIAIMYALFFSRLFEDNFDVKKWWISFGKAASVLILGLILYIISNRVAVGLGGATNLCGPEGLSLGITSDELSVHGYDAQAETGNLYIKEIPYTLRVAYDYFIKYHYNTHFDGANISFASKVNVFSNIIIALCSLVIGFNCLVRQKGIIRRVMVMCVAVCAPFCINSIQILLNGKCDETLQMMYSMVMVTSLIVNVFDKDTLLEKKIKNLLMNIIFIALVVHAYGNYQIINDAYLRMNSEYEAAYGEMCRIVDRIEQLPEWQAGERTVYFDYNGKYGYLVNENYQAFRCVDDYIDMGWMGVFGTQVHNSWEMKNTSNFVKCYFGLEFDEPSAEQISAIETTEQYRNMEKFPSNDSIQVINDVIVVRMDG